MKSTLKTYKNSERLTELYGREAYEAWKARETEIDRFMNTNQKVPSRTTARAIVAKMNGILKRMPLSDAVLDREYIVLLSQIHAGGRWGVLVDGIRMVGGKPWAGVRLVSADEAEYREVCQW